MIETITETLGLIEAVTRLVLSIWALAALLAATALEELALVPMGAC